MINTCRVVNGVLQTIIKHINHSGLKLEWFICFIIVWSTPLTTLVVAYEFIFMNCAKSCANLTSKLLQNLSHLLSSWHRHTVLYLIRINLDHTCTNLDLDLYYKCLCLYNATCADLVQFYYRVDNFRWFQSLLFSGYNRLTLI